MKILYFRLKGYINILQGMGLDEIVIPFADMKSRIVLIQGVNGTGKSTILSALSPEPDSSDSFRRDVMVENGITKIVCYAGEKEIHYTDGTNIYKILFQHIPSSNKSTLTTKAFISKNGVELNPNGNVTSFKDIRNDIFGINPIFLDMSIITSDKRGIVDMTPANRRKYLSSFIGSVDTFNSMYKIFSKKASLCRSRVNNLHTKIANIGDETSLRLQLASLEERLKSLQNEREVYVKQNEHAETTLTLIDPDHKLIDLQESLMEDVRTAKSELAKINKQCGQIYSSFKLDNIEFERDVEYYQTELKSVDDILGENENNVRELENLSSKLVSSKESITESIESDKSRLNGLSSEEVSSNLKEIIDESREYLSTIEIALEHGYPDINITESDDITIATLKHLKDIVEQISRSISVLYDEYGNDDIELIVDIVSTRASLIDIINDLQNKKNELVKQLNSICSRIEKVESERDDLKKLNDKPEDCTNYNCAFIKHYIEIKNYYDSSNTTPESVLEELLQRKTELEKEIESTDSKITQSREISSGVNSLDEIISIYSSVAQQFNMIDVKIDKSTICECIKNHSIAYLSEIISRIESMISYLYTRQEYESGISSLKLLESEYKASAEKEALSNSLRNSITEHEKKLESIETELNKCLKQILTVHSVIDTYKEHKGYIESLIALLQRKEELGNILADLKEKYNKSKEDLKTIDTMLDERNEAVAGMDRVEELIEPLKEEISKLKYTLTSMVEYRAELEEYRGKLERYTFMKDACSPGGGDGIQSAYVKMYMNEILSSCNFILSHMFQGTLQLGTPIIDENEFSIPFIGPWGLEVPDISRGSTAQKCMIGLAFACAAIMHSSESGFIIPRFDEIDGGLDENNRISFIKVVDNILNIMNAEQCIMCSHNNEFDYTNTSRIICTHTGFAIQN